MGEFLTPGVLEPLLTLMGAGGFFFLAFQALKMLEK